MDKATEFLEKHVQWIALGIGGAIFLLALWVFVIQPDVGAEVNGRSAGPGEVDRQVLHGTAGDLKQAMESSVAPPPRTPRLADAFTQELNLGSAQTRVLPIRVVGGGLFPMATPDDDILDRTIDQVPTPPAATVVAANPGRSYVRVLGANGQEQLQDLSYTRVDYEIDPTALASLYRQIALPLRLQPTVILRARLERERLLPDGSYGEQTTIEELADIQDPSLPPLPGEDANEDEKLAYLAYAQENPGPILQPQFYTVEAGDDPFNLGGAIVAPGNGGRPIDDRGFHEGFNPRDPRTWPPDNEMTPQERRAINEAQQQGLPGGEGSEGGMEGLSDTGGNRGSGGNVDWQNQNRQGQNRQGQGGQRPPAAGREGGIPGGYDPSLMPGDELYPGEGELLPEDGFMPSAPGIPGRQDGPAAPSMPGLVAGQFIPSEVKEPIGGWAFDTTAEPGETYRYRVTYAIKNPLFMEPDVAGGPELATMMAAWSDIEEAAWGTDVRVEPLNYFYMTNASPDGQEVQFKVFRWQQGKWQSETFKVRPGDRVGQPTGDIDYRTGSTLVDVRRDPGTNKVFALLVDDQGRFVRRTNDDRNEDQFRQLENAVASAASGGE